MVRVYIWMPKSGKDHLLEESVLDAWLHHIATLNFLDQAIEYGHAAFEIEGEMYASYWPPAKPGEPCALNLDYEEDVAECGREADHIISLQHLNESAMFTYWESAVTKAFNAVRHNCCTVTSQAVQIGFSKGIYEPLARAISPTSILVASLTGSVGDVAGETWRGVAHTAKIYWRAVTHPVKSLNAAVDNTARKVWFNEPVSLLKLVSYYKMLTEDDG